MINNTQRTPVNAMTPGESIPNSPDQGGNANGKPGICFRREQNGSWSAQLEAEESVVRQRWGTTKARFLSFAESVADLGISLGSSGPDRLLFSIHDIADDDDRRELAACRLRAFHQQFLKGTTSEVSGSGQTPPSPQTGGSGDFPTLFTDEDTPVAPIVEEKKASMADHLAVLKESYPRIGSAIELMWGHSECEDYINKLILNDRGSRQGFPTNAMSALLGLFRMHTQAFKFQSGLDKWSENSKKEGPA